MMNRRGDRDWGRDQRAFCVRQLSVISGHHCMRARASPAGRPSIRSIQWGGRRTRTAASIVRPSPVTSSVDRNNVWVSKAMLGARSNARSRADRRPNRIFFFSCKHFRDDEDDGVGGRGKNARYLRSEKWCAQEWLTDWGGQEEVRRSVSRAAAGSIESESRRMGLLVCMSSPLSLSLSRCMSLVPRRRPSGKR